MVLEVDKLTGLLTRQSFDEEFQKVVQQSETHTRIFSLAFLDLDDFKTVNDNFGHSIGDAVLVQVSEIIRGVLGDSALVGRYGGDEFGVLLTEMEREQAFLLLERVRAAVEDAALYMGAGGQTTVRMTCSAGLACYPVDAQTFAELLRKADQAIYRAKVAGRNQVRLAYDERMVPKTTHFTQTQLERLAKLAEKEGVGEAVLLREALDNLLMKYRVTDIES